MSTCQTHLVFGYKFKVLVQVKFCHDHHSLSSKEMCNHKVKARNVEHWTEHHITARLVISVLREQRVPNTQQQMSQKRIHSDWYFVAHPLVYVRCIFPPLVCLRKSLCVICLSHCYYTAVSLNIKR